LNVFKTTITRLASGVKNNFEHVHIVGNTALAEPWRLPFTGIAKSMRATRIAVAPPPRQPSARRIAR